ncbi:hypothetical protein E4H12_02195 [Candidatus Thorarchaeota archaeon]|nr:MAG: hypothetical protein E4H12_02195 [Candidatus Thorarchaeota archaeon]
MAKCNFCDANFEAGAGDLLLVCPFCGTAQSVQGIKFTDHYMIRVHYDEGEAKTTLLDWVSKQLGVPEDLSSSAQFLKSEQIWYPFWISRVDADTTYSGLGRDATFHSEWPQMRGAYKRIEYFWKPESGQFTRRHEINIAGIPNIDEDVRHHPIPTRAKEFFSNAHAEEFDGKVLHSTIDLDTAKGLAKQMAIDRQTQLVLKEVDKIEQRDDNINVGETFLIHVPVWELEYRYGNKKYRASVSAPTGYVIESKYPRSMSFRAGGIGIGFLMLLIGAVLIMLALSEVIGLPIGPLFQGGGLLSGGLLAIIGLGLMYKGASSKEAKESI